jgi:hypothetical protein
MISRVGQGENVSLLPINVTTYLDNNLIESLLGCDLCQINCITNGYGKFLDTIF